MKSLAEHEQATSGDVVLTGGGKLQFSVVVPVYDQWDLVPALLDALTRQILPHNHFEVILVDNASPRFTPPSNPPENAQILHCNTPGSYAARNHGARQARGEWLVFTDADCQPMPDWLSRLDEEIGRHGSGRLMAGAVDVIASTSAPGAWEIFDMVKGIPQERYVARGYAATANLSVPAAVFRELLGFDGRRFSGGDADFCRRAGAAGHPIAYVGRARVEHPARAAWEEIATKVRRIKGGQLTAGSLSLRLSHLVRTMVPPVRGAWHFLRAKRYSLRYRLIAVLVLCRVWMVELAEMVRLAVGRPPERR